MRPDRRVLLNVSVPAAAAAAARLPAHGVGLMRAEFVALQWGRHPQAVAADLGVDALVQMFAKAMSSVAKAFFPRPVLYRSLDLKTNEYRQLAGGDRYEPHEENPMLGLRGVARYLDRPDEFMMELQAMQRVRADGCTNLSLMLPFVRTVDELRDVKALIAPTGLLAEDSFELWAMAEVPAIATVARSFAEEVDGVSVGTNDLMQLLLGVDRDSGAVSSRYDDAGYEALIATVEQIITGAHAVGRPVSSCGDAAGRDPVLRERLLIAGLDSISVVPAAYDEVAKHVDEFDRAAAR